MADDPGFRALPCPSCRMRGDGGEARIGNRRGKCPMCNRFAQATRRIALKRLIERYPDAYDEIRVEAEISLYHRVIEEFLTIYPAARPVETT